MKSAGNANKRSSGGASTWKYIALGMTAILIPWALYVNFHPRFGGGGAPVVEQSTILHSATDLGQTSANSKTSSASNLNTATSSSSSAVVVQSRPAKKLEFPQLPIQGPIPTNGASPLYGIKHKGTDAIFALACNYPKVYYQRFVGSVRKAGFNDDIVLAVSPEEKMKPGIKEYIKQTNIVAYGFDVDCQGPDNCKLKDDFLGYPDPRPFRTFANIRYALYEYWLRHYDVNSYILILDFRDTFFQASPFQSFGVFEQRTEPKYELHMYAENYDVSQISLNNLNCCSALSL